MNGYVSTKKKSTAFWKHGKHKTIPNFVKTEPKNKEKLSAIDLKDPDWSTKRR